ncbi:MAG: hypothetical protein PHR36_00710 [Patescibacteria group bacterium]|nr:hypothetical protein [Patescibacteria group bacterium]
MNEQNIPQREEPIQSSNNLWKIIVPVVITALVVGGGVYAWQRSNLKDTEQNLQQQIANLQSQLNQFQQGQTNLNQQEDINNQASGDDQSEQANDLTANWETYTDNEIGLSFSFPTSWAIGYKDKKPSLSIYSSLISSFQTGCGEMGSCQQDELNNKKRIEDGSMPGIISFNGGKGSLTATCSGNEGGDLIPTPAYIFIFYKGDRSYTISLNDLSTKLNSNILCNSNKYIQDIVKNIPNSIPDANYQTYNDFLLLIKQTLILE